MDQLEERIREELAPDLEIKRTIGRGSMATVFLAREPALRRMVAVKVLRPDVANADTARRRFEREAQAAARLNHASLTDIYRIGRLQLGVPYIVMEYIDGRNLADALKARGPMTIAEVRTVVRSVAEALAAAHAKGIIHRDVRPANVIRDDQSGRVVLTDFGIAALLESGTESNTQLTTMGHRIGNPRYMSPEHLNGETLTVQSDIYSLGVLGYELLTGEGPFAGTGAAAIVAQVHGQPRRLVDLRPDVDPRLATLLERCLARNPEHRPRAEDVAHALSPEGSDLPLLPGQKASQLTLFINELKRRNVTKWGIAWIVIASGTLQLADSVRDNVHFVDMTFNWLVYGLLAGLPIAIILAWVFDYKEGRVSRTAASVGHESTASTGKRTVLIWSGLAMTVAIAGLLAWWFLRD
jgi:serine/threonine protein kinase